MQYAAAISPIRTNARRGRVPRRLHAAHRARIATRVAVGVLLASALLVSILSLAHDPQAPVPSSWGTVAVSQNATLWSIAEAHPVPGRSTVDTIELIAAENGLTESIIHAGQVLRVPIPEPALVLVQR